MSTQPLYIGFRHLKTGTQILRNVSDTFQEMKDHYNQNGRTYGQDEISTYLCDLKMEDMKPTEYAGSILYGCFLLLTVTKSFKDQSNFYLITIDETESNKVKTQLDFAYVGNDNSAVTCFKSLGKQLTPA